MKQDWHVEFDSFSVEYEPGELLFREGESGEKFYMVAEGLVDVDKKTDGESVTVATVSPGEILGEMALVGEVSDRSATARAQTEVICLEFSREKFDHLLETSEDFRARVRKLLCNRLRKTTEELSQAEEQSARLEKSSVFLLYLIESNNLYQAGPQTLEYNPDAERLARFFDVEPERLQLLLSTASEEDPTQFSPRLTEIAAETAVNVVEKFRRKFNIETSFPGEISLPEPSSDELTVSRAAEVVERLYIALKNSSAGLSSDEREEINRRCQQLNSQYDQENVQKLTDLGRLRAYARGVKRIL